MKVKELIVFIILCLLVIINAVAIILVIDIGFHQGVTKHHVDVSNYLRVGLIAGGIISVIPFIALWTAIFASFVNWTDRNHN